MGRGEGGGRRRKGKERGGRARLGFVPESAEFLVTPLGELLYAAWFSFSRWRQVCHFERK